MRCEGFLKRMYDLLWVHSFSLSDFHGEAVIFHFFRDLFCPQVIYCNNYVYQSALAHFA